MRGFRKAFADVLGTEYRIRLRTYEDDSYFKEATCDGYCATSTKEIIISDAITNPNYVNVTLEEAIGLEKLWLRHELVHAFLYESGLGNNTSIYGGAWSSNEEMVDWTAILFPKMTKVFKELDLL